eukprot:TRINITY_DN1700_c0_g2_i1.p1 TRINITY_DN1700_c0_g2~~TRINITY_DN1700_c0_g2_i1.p1  ORF type:complete len:181 (+),score=24.34 TRINITY_DN1700_c0_g2_i1:3-545(+)
MVWFTPFVVLTLAVTAIRTRSIRIDVKAEYGIDEEGIYQAISAAKQHLYAHCSDQVEVYFAAGTFVINQTKNGIDLSHINPCAGGRIIISGESKESTTLSYTNWHQDTLFARNASRVTIRDIRFTRNYQTVSQGDLLGNDPGSITICLHPGFHRQPNYTMHAFQLVGSSASSIRTRQIQS